MLISQFGHFTTYPQLRQDTNELYPRRFISRIACSPRAAHSFSAAGIAFLVSVAVTAFAVRLDTTRPQFAVGGDGELAVGNVSTFVVLFVGFAISVLYGLFGMVGIFLWGLTKTFLILFGVSFLLAVGAVLWLMIGLDKRYERIAQR